MDQALATIHTCRGIDDMPDSGLVHRLDRTRSTMIVAFAAALAFLWVHLNKNDLVRLRSGGAPSPVQHLLHFFHHLLLFVENQRRATVHLEGDRLATHIRHLKIIRND